MPDVSCIYLKPIVDLQPIYGFYQECVLFVNKETKQLEVAIPSIEGYLHIANMEHLRQAEYAVAMLVLNQAQFKNEINSLNLVYTVYLDAKKREVIQFQNTNEIIDLKTMTSWIQDNCNVSPLIRYYKSQKRLVKRFPISKY